MSRVPPGVEMFEHGVVRLVPARRSTLAGGLVAFSAAVVFANNMIVVADLGAGGSLVAGLCLMGAAVAFADWWGMGRDDLGAGPTAWRAGVVYGGVPALVFLIAAALAVALAGGGGLSAVPWFRVLVGIPIGTAMVEEVIFRGVLLALWDRVVGRRWSVVVTSVAFGLWHVAAELNRTSWSSPESILPGVGATALASALVLCPLRRRSDSVLAPMLLHAGFNVSVLLVVALGVWVP